MKALRTRCSQRQLSVRWVSAGYRKVAICNSECPGTAQRATGVPRGTYIRPRRPAWPALGFVLWRTDRPDGTMPSNVQDNAYRILVKYCMVSCESRFLWTLSQRQKVSWSIPKRPARPKKERPDHEPFPKCAGGDARRRYADHQD